MSSTMYQVLLPLYSFMILEQTVLEILEEPEWVGPAIRQHAWISCSTISFWTNCKYKRKKEKKKKIYIYR